MANDSIIQYLIILLICTEESREFNENPEDFNVLNLGGETYFDTIKSVTIKLLRTVQQYIYGKEQLAFILNEIHEFCHNFINVYFKSTETIAYLIQNDEILCKYTSSQIFGACIYFITLSRDIKAIETVTVNLEDLLKIYSICSNCNKYLLIKLFIERMHCFIEYDKHISQMLSFVCENLEENIDQLKYVSIEFLSKLVQYTSKIFDLHTQEFQEIFMSILGKIITNKSCGVDDFIAACIKHKVISFTEIVELCRIVVKNLKEELQKTPEGHISIKAQRYCELIKALLKSECYCDSVYQYLKGKCLTDKFCLAIFEIDGDDNIVLLLDFENPNINEQILCICSLMISISKEIQPKMVECLQSIEGVYSRIGMISNEIAETVNYFCQHGWEQIDEHQQILESLIHIGINEIQCRNANYEMHRVQGIVFLQTMFVNMIATENLKPYIYKIIEICINLLNEENIDQEERPKFLRPITVLILILLWYDSEITLDAIAKIGKEFMIFSMILTFVKKVKYSFECKASIISLIKFMEKYKSPDCIPIFNLKVFESILYILAKRLQIYNYKLKLQEEYRENDQELDDFSSDYESGCDSEIEGEDENENENETDYTVEYEYKEALKRVPNETIENMNEFKEFHDFINKIYHEEKETIIVIKFNKPQDLVEERIKLYMQKIIQNQLCLKSKNNLKTIMAVKSFSVEGSNTKVIHRKIVKAVRRGYK